MIHKLRDMVGSADFQVGLKESGGTRWVRPVPFPFFGGFKDRLHDAWEVLQGRAYAVRWPEHGELEDALRQGED